MSTRATKSVSAKASSKASSVLIAARKATSQVRAKAHHVPVPDALARVATTSLLEEDKFIVLCNNHPVQDGHGRYIRYSKESDAMILSNALRTSKGIPTNRKFIYTIAQLQNRIEPNFTFLY